ncbi:MAG: ComEA family DNA-binding protein [Lachnospiraceae bacterium]|nr:ComEA family DNA-binding protein [Lachnospiraceae bacterium]
MTYKRIRNLAVFGLALLLSMSLSGCSFSFLGFRLGKSEDFVFYCAEDVESDTEDAADTGDISTVESAETDGGSDEAGVAAGTGVSRDVSDEEPVDARVNINTADRTELMTLNGIGESRADAIIEYRTQNGSFTSPEQIMEVSGIAEGIYAKIKDQIRVQ